MKANLNRRKFDDESGEENKDLKFKVKKKKQVHAPSKLNQQINSAVAGGNQQKALQKTNSIVNKNKSDATTHEDYYSGSGGRN